MDLDLPDSDDNRLKKTIPTIKILLENNFSIVIVGHKGRPKGIGYEEKYSLFPVYLRLQKILDKNFRFKPKTIFIPNITDEDLILSATEENEIVFVENMRFDEREKKGDTSIYQIVQKFFPFFINDSFAVSHRGEASILLHRQMTTFYGLDFIQEYDKLNWLQKQAGYTLILGGAKEDKLTHLPILASKAKHVLIGGKLPVFKEKFTDLPNKNIFWANLCQDGCDLNQDDIKTFKDVINDSEIIIWAGPLGWFENPNYKKGTMDIAQAITQSHAYIATAGGDTSAAIKEVSRKINPDRYFACCGGGALLAGLADFDHIPAWS